MASVSQKELKIALGHWTNAMQLRREASILLSDVWQFSASFKALRHKKMLTKAIKGRVCCVHVLATFDAD
eukprot:5307975-Karenia_brevis.AAC.1